MIPELPVWEILACSNKCSVHLGPGSSCGICGEMYTPTTKRTGQLLAVERPSFVYVPIRERLLRLHVFTCFIPVHHMFLTCFLPVYSLFGVYRLLRSDLCVLLDYSTRRSEKNLRDDHDDFMSDLFDSESYKRIADMVNGRATNDGVPLGLIVLFFSADGYNLFETNNRSLWPFSYFVASLPPKLRHLMHVGIQIYLLRIYLFSTCFLRVLYLFISCSAYSGMHIAALDSGGHRATMDSIGRELLDLWENPMKGKDGKGYVVAAMGFNFDTKAYEKMRGQQGSASYKGCFFCHGDLGKMVGKTMCYPCHRAFLSINHPYRRRSSQEYENQKPFWPTPERRCSPGQMTNAEYLVNGAQAREEGVPVNGVKIEWPLGILPYHEHIVVEVSRIFDVVLFVYFLYNMFLPCLVTVQCLFITCLLPVYGM